MNFHYSSAKKLGAIILSTVLSVCACPSFVCAADEGAAKATTQFTVVFDQLVNALNGRNGFIGHLRTDLSTDGRVLAGAGSLVKGHIEALGSYSDLTKAAGARANVSSSTPFRVVFDEIVTPDGHSFKMHAVPANQCSMVTDAGRLRSIEVTTGGIVRNPERDSPVLLGKGDELVVRISKDRSYFKGTSEAPLLAQSAGVISPLPVAARSSSRHDQQASEMRIATRLNTVSATPAQADTSAESSPDSDKFDETRKTNAPKSSGNSAKDAKKAAPTDSDDEIETAEKAKKDDGEEEEDPAAVEAKKKQKLDVDPEKAQAFMAKKGITADGTMSQNFKVEFVTPLSTYSSHVDDQVLAVLKEDMKLGMIVIAKKGSAVIGHIAAIRQSCRWGQAVKSNKGQKNATISIQFDRLVTTNEDVLPIFGVTPQQEVVFKAAGTFKTLTVSPQGEITKDAPIDFTDHEEASGLANIAMMALAGPQAAVAAPLILLGALGKAQPVITRTIQKKVVGKGDEVVVYPGDQITVQARLIDPAKEQLYVAGTVLHGKNLKTIRTAESHPSVE